MGIDLVQITALVGLAVIAVIFASELRKWRSVDSVIGHRQRMLRIWLLALVEALFVMMLVGPWVTSRKDPITALLYWVICLGLTLVVMALALLDLREIARQYSRLNRQLFRDLRGDDERRQ